ncbi:MAG: sensor domain-containing diguanylate cyclase [Desulfuromonadaceae bacterium]|nr:sensor domain-containing diguanylate cyclase [Desulfuromonadaceae bacterium]
MSAPLATTEYPETLLKRFAAAPELEPFELALYDRQFLLLAISSSKAALCGNPTSPFCNPACHARRAAKMAMAEANDEPRLIQCPGSLQHCLVPCRNTNGQRTYLLIGGGREPQSNLQYLEELACLNQVEAFPLLQQWNQLQQFEASKLLEAGRTAQSLFLSFSAPSPRPRNDSPALSEALIDALFQADTVLASATDQQTLSEAINTLLEPAFGPRSISLLVPGESEPDLLCLDKGSASPAEDSEFLSAKAGSNETLQTCDAQMTCLPLQGDKELLGNLLCNGPALSARDMLLLNMISERISGRLQQLRSPQTAPEDSAPHDGDFNHLLTLTTPQELCQRILENAVTQVPANKASLMLLNSNGSKLHLLANLGMNQAMAADLCIPSDQGIAGQVLQSGQALLVENMEQDPRISSVPRPRFESKTFLCLPLTTGDKHHGVISLADRQDGQPFNQQDLDLLTKLAGPCALLIERLCNRQQVSTLLDQAALDPATEVYSASMFKRRFTEEASRATRLRQGLALLLFKADQPDETSHQQAINLATRLKDLVRKMDVVGRLDNNLFAVLLPDTASEVALTIANRLHSQQDDAGNDLPSVACGIALYPSNGASFDPLLQSAKTALTKAHQQGGNRATLCQSSARNNKIVFL